MQGEHIEDREEMGKRVEGVQACYSQVHEEISSKSSMPRPPLAPGQEADPTSLKRGEDYLDEWAKRQAKLVDKPEKQ